MKKTFILANIIINLFYLVGCTATTPATVNPEDTYVCPFNTSADLTAGMMISPLR